MKSILVTGVSTGIGRATAEVLAQRGFRVFGSVRRAADADLLGRTLGKAFVPLVFDVTDEVAVRAAADEVAVQLGKARLAGLVNNAGIAVAGPLTDLPVAQFRHQLEVNLVGPMLVTQAFLPLLGTDPKRSGEKGRVVNISSVGGKLGAPFLGPYVASKFGIEGFSESLRRELLVYGVDVIVVAPGHVATPIWDKAEQMDVSGYEHLPVAPMLRRFREFFIAEGRLGYPPERVAAVIHEALTVPAPKARYAVVKGRLRNWSVPINLPVRVVDRLIAAQLGLKPPPKAGE